MKTNPLLWWRWRGSRDVEVSSADDERRALLSAYLDDEVSQRERAEVEAAVASDATLEADLAELRVVRDALAGLGEVRAPRSFAIAAPPVAAARGLSRFELVIRVSASVASLAFVMLLVAGEPDFTGGVPSAVRQERTRDAAGSSASGVVTSAAPTLRDSGASALPEAMPATASAPASGPAPEPRPAQEDVRRAPLAAPETAPKIAPTAAALAPAAPVIAPALSPALAPGSTGASTVATATPAAGATPEAGMAALGPVGTPTGTPTGTPGAAATPRTLVAPAPETPTALPASSAAPATQDVAPSATTVAVRPTVTATSSTGERAAPEVTSALPTSVATIAPPAATAVASVPALQPAAEAGAPSSVSDESAAATIPARPLTLAVGIVSAALLIAAVAQWAIRTK